MCFDWRMNRWLALTVGSIAGGFGRYFLTGALHGAIGSGFPYGTFVINISGCFLIGIFHAMAEAKGILNAEARLLLMTGFCGAYTTFSTFMLDASHLLRHGQNTRALAYVGGSVLIGFALFRLGEWLGGAL